MEGGAVRETVVEGEKAHAKEKKAKRKRGFLYLNVFYIRYDLLI